IPRLAPPRFDEDNVELL
ncbi:putative sortilin, partial [Toxoplasma gondii ARI]